MQRRKLIQELTILSILIALIILMSFTPIGYIKIGPGLEITILVIPVVIGAILVGPKGGTILGLTFGITSFLQCVLGTSVFGATLFNMHPFLTFLVCVPTRTLMGFLTGLIYKLILKKFKHDVFPQVIACVIGALLNTILFMSVLCLCFYRTDYIQGFCSALKSTNVVQFIILFVGVNGLLEIIFSTVVGAALSKVLSLYEKKYQQKYLQKQTSIK